MIESIINKSQIVCHIIIRGLNCSVEILFYILRALVANNVIKFETPLSVRKFNNINLAKIRKCQKIIGQYHPSSHFDFSSEIFVCKCLGISSHTLGTISL